MDYQSASKYRTDDSPFNYYWCSTNYFTWERIIWVFITHHCDILAGKTAFFLFLCQTFFYENNLIGSNYAEPYAGGAGLALRLLFEGYVNHIYINDLDKSIYAFWVSIISKPEEFCKWISDIEVSIENWQICKEIQKNVDDIGFFEQQNRHFFSIELIFQV